MIIFSNMDGDISLLNVHRGVDCKTVGFFLKISNEIGKAWRKSLVPHTPACVVRLKRLSLVSLSVFSLVPDILFDC